MFDLQIGDQIQTGIAKQTLCLLKATLIFDIVSSSGELIFSEVKAFLEYKPTCQSQHL